MQRRFFIALALLASSLGNPAQAQSLPWPQLYDPHVLRQLDLTLAPADWDTIRHDTTNSLKVAATLQLDGGTPVAVTVRRKSSRALPSEADPRKVGLKVDVDSGTWQGVKKLSLENGGDSGPVKEGVAWALQQLAAPAPYHAALAAWVNVRVNGENLGVYVNVEQRDKQFLRNRGLYDAPTTWVYKQDDIGPVERDVAPTEDPASPLYDSPAFKALCWVPFGSGSASGTTATAGGGKKGGGGSTGCTAPKTDRELWEQLTQWIDMDAMLRQGAVDAITDNGDALFTKGKNFFVLDFAASRNQPRLYYPWDLDGVFRSTTAGIYGVVGRGGKVTQTPYQQVVLNHPLARARYNALLLELLNGPLALAQLYPWLDAAYAAVLTDLHNDPYHRASVGDFERLKTWLAARDGQVRAQVNANSAPLPRPGY